MERFLVLEGRAGRRATPRVSRRDWCVPAKNLAAGNSEGPQSRREFANISPPGCPKSEMPRRLYLPTSVQREPCKMVVVSPTFLPLITCPERFHLGSILQFGNSAQAGQWLNNGETGTAEVKHPSRRTALSQQCFFWLIGWLAGWLVGCLLACLID